jgi:hypothetical protein
MYIRDNNTFYLAPQGPAAPESFEGNSRSVVAFDMDNDGDLDLLANNYAQPPRLLRNDTKGDGHWLKVALQGEGANTRAVGAVLELTAGGRTMRRIVTCGDGYLGQQDGVVHFGLGDAKAGDLTVRWPDGTEQVLQGLAADALHEVSRASKGA